MPNRVGSLTPQRVAGALKRAGFDASKSHTTSVRGWKDYTEGFRTFISYTNERSIGVTWQSSNRLTNTKRVQAQVLRMKEVLAKEGFDVDFGQTDTILTVKLKAGT